MSGVASLLEERRVQWNRLEELCNRRQLGGKRLTPAEAIEFAAVYRAVCADLALADSYGLPPRTVEYLHQLVARAHTSIYRTAGFSLRRWLQTLFHDAPRTIARDGYFITAFCLFWGVFLFSMYLASNRVDYANAILGDSMQEQLADSFAAPLSGRAFGEDSVMAGFYIQHNTSIGLRCFAMGVLFGVGGLFATVYNAAFLGASFGFMTTIPQGDNFFEFVVGHGPFELTAIVLSAAAGMRLGFSLIDTGGLMRTASLQKAAGEATPVMGLGIVLFIAAAFIEGFVSPSGAPFVVKAAVGAGSTCLLLFYFVLLGAMGLYRDET